MRLILVTALVFAVAACSEVKPSPVVSPGLDSGVTSNNGGGSRQLNNNQNMGVTSRPGVAQ